MSSSQHNSGHRRAPFRSDPDYVRERRQVIRGNHPDRGGSDASLIEALADLDARWRKKTDANAYLRSQFVERRPSFMDEAQANQTFDTAEQYADQFQRKTADLISQGQRQGQRIREYGEVFAQSTIPRRMRRSAGKVIGGASRSVRSRLPRKFPGAKRFTETD